MFNHVKHNKTNKHNTDLLGITDHMLRTCHSYPYDLHLLSVLKEANTPDLVILEAL